MPTCRLCERLRRPFIWCWGAWVYKEEVGVWNSQISVKSWYNTQCWCQAAEVVGMKVQVADSTGGPPPAEAQWGNNNNNISRGAFLPPWLLTMFAKFHGALSRAFCLKSRWLIHARTGISCGKNKDSGCGRYGRYADRQIGGYRR